MAGTIQAVIAPLWLAPAASARVRSFPHGYTPLHGYTKDTRSNIIVLVSLVILALVYCGQTVGWIKMKLGMQSFFIHYGHA